MPKYTAEQIAQNTAPGAQDEYDNQIKRSIFGNVNMGMVYNGLSHDARVEQILSSCFPGSLRKIVADLGVLIMLGSGDYSVSDVLDPEKLTEEKKQIGQMIIHESLGQREHDQRNPGKKLTGAGSDKLHRLAHKGLQKMHSYVDNWTKRGVFDDMSAITDPKLRFIMMMYVAYEADLMRDGKGTFLNTWNEIESQPGFEGTKFTDMVASHSGFLSSIDQLNKNKTRIAQKFRRPMGESNLGDTLAVALSNKWALEKLKDLERSGKIGTKYTGKVFDTLGSISQLNGYMNLTDDDEVDPEAAKHEKELAAMKNDPITKNLQRPLEQLVKWASASAPFKQMMLERIQNDTLFTGRVDYRTYGKGDLTLKGNYDGDPLLALAYAAQDDPVLNAYVLEQLKTPEGVREVMENADDVLMRANHKDAAMPSRLRGFRDSMKAVADTLEELESSRHSDEYKAMKAAVDLAMSRLNRAVKNEAALDIGAVRRMRSVMNIVIDATRQYINSKDENLDPASTQGKRVSAADRARTIAQNLRDKMEIAEDQRVTANDAIIAKKHPNGMVSRGMLLAQLKTFSKMYDSMNRTARTGSSSQYKAMMDKMKSTITLLRSCCAEGLDLTSGNGYSMLGEYNDQLRELKNLGNEYLEYKQTHNNGSRTSLLRMDTVNCLVLSIEQVAPEEVPGGPKAQPRGIMKDRFLMHERSMQAANQPAPAKQNNKIADPEPEVLPQAEEPIAPANQPAVEMAVVEEVKEPEEPEAEVVNEAPKKEENVAEAPKQEENANEAPKKEEKVNEAPKQEEAEKKEADAVNQIDADLDFEDELEIEMEMPVIGAPRKQAPVVFKPEALAAEMSKLLRSELSLASYFGWVVRNELLSELKAGKREQVLNTDIVARRNALDAEMESAKKDSGLNALFNQNRANNWDPVEFTRKLNAYLAEKEQPGFDLEELTPEEHQQQADLQAKKQALLDEEARRIEQKELDDAKLQSQESKGKLSVEEILEYNRHIKLKDAAILQANKMMKEHTDRYLTVHDYVYAEVCRELLEDIVADKTTTVDRDAIEAQVDLRRDALVKELEEHPSLRYAFSTVEPGEWEPFNITASLEQARKELDPNYHVENQPQPEEAQPVPEKVQPEPEKVKPVQEEPKAAPAKKEDPAMDARAIEKRAKDLRRRLLSPEVYAEWRTCDEILHDINAGKRNSIPASEYKARVDMRARALRVDYSISKAVKSTFAFHGGANWDPAELTSALKVVYAKEKKELMKAELSKEANRSKGKQGLRRKKNEPMSTIVEEDPNTQEPEPKAAEMKPKLPGM